MEGDLTWSGEYIIQYTYYGLYNCIPETYIILLTNVTPMKLIKKKKIEIIALNIASKIKYLEINSKKKCKTCTLKTIKHNWNLKRLK